MKKAVALLIGMLALAECASAQDVILTKDADEIQAKVLKVGPAEIEYKRWDNPDGPTYSIPAKEVFIIKYQNGTKETISTLPSAGKRFTDSQPHYEGGIAAAYGIGVGQVSEYINTNRFVVETVHGCRFNPYFAAGAGLGFNYFYDLGDDTKAGALSYFINLKGYYPFSDKRAVYLSFDMGAASGISGDAEGNEFYTSIGPGIRFGQGDFGIRFQYIGPGANGILFRLGVNF